jgi:hypothetical protein
MGKEDTDASDIVRDLFELLMVLKVIRMWDRPGWQRIHEYVERRKKSQTGSY